MDLRLCPPRYGQEAGDGSYQTKNSTTWTFLMVPVLHASEETTHSALMFAALMIGHHFSSSALWKVRNASGVSCSRGGISIP
jgi:hypothetical protein